MIPSGKIVGQLALGMIPSEKIVGQLALGTIPSGKIVGQMPFSYPICKKRAKERV